MTVRFHDLLMNAWAVWAAMAPYLLLGFVIAGVLSVWLSAAWVRRHLGGGGWRSALRAALFGVPLPLCSCSVLPVAASLRAQGASRGAVGAFLMATPQVGINSLIVTYGVLGPVVAVVRALTAFVSGWFCGTAVDAAVPPEPSGADAAAAESAGADGLRETAPAWRRILRHAFVTLPRSLAAPMLVGISVSAFLGAWLPPGYFLDRLAPGLTAMLLMLVIGIPLYVCSTSSIPVALALIHAGVPVGAALVFLVTGPATNAITIVTLFRLLGRRAALIYLATLVAAALLAGWLLDGWLLVRQPDLVDCHFPETGRALWEHAAGIILAVVLLWQFIAARIEFFRRGPGATDSSPPVT